MLKGKSYHIAIVGATGAVGAELLRVLERRGFPVERLLPLSSSRSAGRTVPFRGVEIGTEELQSAECVARRVPWDQRPGGEGAEEDDQGGESAGAETRPCCFHQIRCPHAETQGPPVSPLAKGNRGLSTHGDRSHVDWHRVTNKPEEEWAGSPPKSRLPWHVRCRPSAPPDSCGIIHHSERHRTGNCTGGIAKGGGPGLSRGRRSI